MKKVVCMVLGWRKELGFSPSHELSRVCKRCRHSVPHKPMPSCRSNRGTGCKGVVAGEPRLSCFTGSYELAGRENE